MPGDSEATAGLATRTRQQAARAMKNAAARRVMVGIIRRVGAKGQGSGSSAPYACLSARTPGSRGAAAPPLPSPTRIAPHVRHELRLRRVWPLLQVHQPPAGVIEGGARVADGGALGG